MTADASDAPATVLRGRQSRLSRMARRPPLLVYLAGLTLIVLIPALLFSAFLILQFSRQQQEIAAAQVSQTAEIISNSIDREIFGMITAAKVLASSPFIDTSDLKAFHDRTMAALVNADADAALIDPAMRVVVNTRRPFPSPPVEPVYRRTIESVFRTRQPQVSGVFFNQPSGVFLFHVAVPVTRDGKVAYVLVINKETTKLASVIADKNLPPAWTAIIQDLDGHKVIAAISSGGKLHQKPETSYENPSIAETLGSANPGDMIEATYMSQLSGWITTVAVPVSVIGRPIMRSWWLLAGTGLLLILFCGALAVVFGRRIATPIRRLAHQARAIGKGEPALPVKTNIDEIGEVSRILARASRDRREAEEQNRFLMREMTHRAKNQYALIAAIARRAAKESANTNEFLATLSDALASLARSADLLAGRGWESAELAELISAQLKAFGAGASDQICLKGPALRLNPTAAQTLGLALHELATNAAKYGALSVEDGRVSIEWVAGEEFALTWGESGGPPVSPPTHSGFGTLVTQKMTARGLGGAVEMKYARTGVVWRLTAPLEAVAAPPAG